MIDRHRRRRHHRRPGLDEAAILVQATGADPKTMLYGAFEGESFTALLGGHIQVYTGDVAEQVANIEAGQVRVLAALAPGRLPAHGRIASIPSNVVKTSVLLLLTASAGSLGGGLFAWIGMPASWLAGSMVAVAAAALAGLPIVVPDIVRNTAFVLIGISMGAGVTREALGQMAAWPLSLAILAVSVVVTLFASSTYLQRVRGWDAATARFSSVPGAMSAVLILAVTSSADLPRVALAQSVRLFTLVALIPAILQISGFSGEGTIAVAAPASGSPLGVAIMLTVSAGGAWILHSLRVPGGVLLGSMLASALLHGADIVSGRPPPAILIPGFIATGAVIGARFRGASMAVMRSTLPAALESVLLALVVSAGFAALASVLLDLPFGQLWLAYAPGGVEAMAVMAFALHLDPAFVGAHHVLRIVGLNVFSPLWRPARAKSAAD